MFLWRRFFEGNWLASREAELFALAPGRVAVSQRPGRKRALVEIACRSQLEVHALERRLGGRAERLTRAWLEKYLSAQKRPPLRIGRRLVVLTAADADEPRPQLVIPAAGAFGTGEHATTAMSLRLLERQARSFVPGWRLLDVGTGTGILALAARRFGAGEVLGLDVDARAVAHARSNARLNQITRAKFITADLLSWRPTQRFDLITANLFSALLIAALPTFRRALRRGGALILSGILRDQGPEVLAVLHRAGYTTEIRRRGKWLALLCTTKQT
jgi:ribosomal protein L11 methyltransferase